MFGKKPPRNMNPQDKGNQNPEEKKKKGTMGTDSLDINMKGERSLSGPPPQRKLSFKKDSQIPMPEPPVKIKEVNLGDGSKRVEYSAPQKIDRLISDAKSKLIKETKAGDKIDPRFFSNGWVVGDGLAKIAKDGKSITYYPDEVAELVNELMGPDSDL